MSRSVTHVLLSMLLLAWQPMARGRRAAWLVALCLVLQPFAAAQHEHEAAAKPQHCVSCMLHAQPQAAPPDTVLAVAPFSWNLLHALAPAPLRQRLARPVDYLLPPSHAPPVFLLAD